MKITTLSSRFYGRRLPVRQVKAIPSCNAPTTEPILDADTHLDDDMEQSEAVEFTAAESLDARKPVFRGFAMPLY